MISTVYTGTMESEQGGIIVNRSVDTFLVVNSINMDGQDIEVT